jgi:ABC-type hemin transport system ATPase subunit
MAKDVAKLVQEIRVKHLHYSNAFNETLAHVSLAPRGSVVALVGPTRVGKSSVVKDVLGHAFPAKPANGTRPCIYIDAATTERGFMSTKYLTLRALAALEHPFYVDDSQFIRLSQTETAARIRLTRALEHRQTKLMVVDEAHHLLRAMERSRTASALDR